MLAPNEVGHRVEDVAKDILDAKLLPIVLDALSSEVVDSTVKEGVCGLVANLALVPTAKRSIVKTSNAIPALLATMRGNREVSVREPACAALMYIAFGSAENRGKITKAGGLAAIMASIQTFPKDPVMLISAFGLMKELALKDEEVASDFVNQGGSAFVLSGMAEHSHLAMMQVAACGVISYLPFTKRDKIAPKLAKAIVSALENHPDVVNVQAACCEALLEIATNVPAVRKLVKDKKSRKLLLEAKEKFRDCESDVMDLLAF